MWIPVHDASATSLNHLYHSLANGLSISGEKHVNQEVKIRLADKTQFKKWQPCDQFRLSRLIARKSLPDEQHTVDVVWLEDVCHKAAIDHQPLNTCPER